ncbi:4'-phosphopantetheinyl transferase family protein [Streptomyces sp. NPDC093589]|uniref:4'-phosphopantetheinyl transferase family protein n=1 Tax=Streptomyces sp. NPDC093589 TaxID=3366043 RepID=UPI00380A9B0F
MTTPLLVADEVWVATTTADRITPSAHRQDVRRAAALPDRRAREFLTGRGLLRETLAALRPALADADITTDPRGKPWLRGHPDVGISVSHSHRAIAVGVAAGRTLGVDVQHPAPSVTATFARRLLHDHVGRIAALPPARAAEEVAWVWTVQEACVKASGAGFTGRPWTIDVPPGARTGRWGDYRWISLRDRSPLPLSCAFSVPRGPAAPPGAHPPASEQT